MAIGALLFVIFVRRAGLAEVAAGVASVGWGFLLVLALSGFRFAMRALAWTLCVEPPGRLTFREALVATVAGDALGNVTPLGLLVSEPAKVALVTRRLPASGALAALAVENLFYSLSVAIVLAAGLIALVARLGTGTSWWIAGGGVVGGLAQELRNHVKAFIGMMNQNILGPYGGEAITAQFANTFRKTWIIGFEFQVGAVIDDQLINVRKA